jgi:hypothetical protein
MSNTPCPGCGAVCPVDSSGPEAFCTGCGTVVGDNSLTAEVEFAESGGASSAVGQFVGTSGGVGLYGMSVGAGFARKSREATVAVVSHDEKPVQKYRSVDDHQRFLTKSMAVKSNQIVFHY